MQPYVMYKLLVVTRQQNTLEIFLGQRTTGSFTNSERHEISVDTKNLFFSSAGILSPTHDVGNSTTEYLERVIHKRPSQDHVLILPRLVTYKRQKKVHNIVDIILTILVGKYFWSKNMNEP